MSDKAEEVKPDTAQGAKDLDDEDYLMKVIAARATEATATTDKNEETTQEENQINEAEDINDPGNGHPQLNAEMEEQDAMLRAKTASFQISTNEPTQTDAMEPIQKENLDQDVEGANEMNTVHPQLNSQMEEQDAMLRAKTASFQISMPPLVNSIQNNELSTTTTPTTLSQQIHNLEAKRREKVLQMQNASISTTQITQEMQDFDEKCRTSAVTLVPSGNDNESSTPGAISVPPQIQSENSGSIAPAATQLRRSQPPLRQSIPGAIPMPPLSASTNVAPLGVNEIEPDSTPFDVSDDDDVALPEPDPEDLLEEGLAQATPLGDSKHFMVHAREYTGSMSQSQRSLQNHRNKSSHPAFCLFAIAILALVLGLGLGLGLRKDDNNPIPSTPAPSSIAPSAAPSSAPTNALDLLIGDLPNYTLQSLQKYDTPQWLAMDWLSNHPGLALMEEWRKKQLFALATFFFAFKGPQWKEEIRNDWLDYAKSECLWFSNKFVDFQSSGSFVDIDWFEEEPDPCNEAEQFVNLRLRWLGQLNEVAVPPEVELLTSLDAIALEFSGINGTLSDFLPPQFYKLHGLTRLSLGDNRLSGSIPAQFQHLTRLKHLFLQANALSGTIPSWIELLTDLQHFTVSSNPITGWIPSGVGLLTKLTHLDFQNNLMSGSIPTELAALLNLVNLESNENALTGNIPTELGLMTKLTKLRFTKGELTGPIPSELGLLTQMTQLDLWENSLVGSIPTEFGQMTDTNWLAIDKNDLTGPIPSELGMMTQMTYFGIFVNKLSGSIPTELGLMQEMVDFHLWNNTLSGSLPSEIFSFPHWRQCSFHFNRLNGTLPTEFGLITNLARVRIHHNQFSGVIPSQFGLLQKVEQFVTQGNVLTGTIPTEIASMAFLRILDFGHNALTGPIPSELGSLSKAGEEPAGDGSIPANLVHLSELQSIAFQNNDLTGPIPTQLGLLSKLEGILLGETLLSGDIPSQFGQLTNLGVLEMSNMALLSGAIPEEVSNLTLKLLRVEGSNQLTGTIAEGLCNIGADEACELTYGSLRYQSGSRACLVDFDCSEQLCGCNCTCA